MADGKRRDERRDGTGEAGAWCMGAWEHGKVVGHHLWNMDVVVLVPNSCGN
jgi:hypothetical protein